MTDFELFTFDVAAGDDFGSKVGAVSGKRARRVPTKLQQVSCTSLYVASDIKGESSSNPCP